MRAASTCWLPKGAAAVAGSKVAVVYSRLLGTAGGASLGEATVRYTGCLRSSGKRQRLVDVPPDDPYVSKSVDHFQLAGRFVAWVETTTDHLR